MTPIDRILGSTAFRLSFAYAVLLVAAFASVGFGVWSTTRSLAETRARERILAEVHFLRDELASEGLAGAILAIEHRELRPEGLLFSLTGPDGVIHGGDLPPANAQLGWRFLDVNGKELVRPGVTDLVVYSERLPGGEILSVGDDLERAETERAEVLRALVRVGTPAVLIAILTGVWVTRWGLRRMSALSTTMTRVSEGVLSARAPARAPARDDFDRLSIGVNAMLDRIVVLITNIRRVSMVVAHELRTPLTHVGQDLEFASASASASTREHIVSAQHRIEGLLRTFDAMLRLAEIETANARVRFGPVALDEVVEAVTSAYRPDVEASGGVLLAHVDAPSAITGDEDLLKQALANLIENAMVHAGQAPHIKVACETRQGEWKLVVSDNGRGVAARDRAKVLEPFGRLNASRSTSGAGLGLAIVASIAKLHDAELLLEDAEPGLRVVISGKLAV